MSWPAGSSTRWRRIRAYVLERDGWICQLCHRPIDRDWCEQCRGTPIPRIHRYHPWSAAVHHTRARAEVGDDPRYLQAAHRECNAKAGPPQPKQPKPKRISSW